MLLASQLAPEWKESLKLLVDTGSAHTWASATLLRIQPILEAVPREREGYRAKGTR